MACLARGYGLTAPRAACILLMSELVRAIVLSDRTDGALERHIMRPRTTFGALAVAGALALTACSGSSSGPGAPDAAISMRLYDDVGSLDPALTAGGPGYQISMFLYDRVIAVTD